MTTPCGRLRARLLGLCCRLLVILMDAMDTLGSHLASLGPLEVVTSSHGPYLYTMLGLRYIFSMLDTRLTVALSENHADTLDSEQGGLIGETVVLRQVAVEVPDLPVPRAVVYVNAVH